jgi:hypothetical protein
MRDLGTLLPAGGVELPLIMCAQGIVKCRVLESADFTGSKLYRIGWTRQLLCAAPRILVQSVTRDLEVYSMLAFFHLKVKTLSDGACVRGLAIGELRSLRLHASYRGTWG